jgi:acetyltransferase-like isoleucine patch superfamily enzyme
MAPQRKPNKYLSLIIWLLPNSGVKRWALRALGNNIAESATTGSTLVLGCGTFSLGDDCIVSKFNIFKGLAHIRMDGKNFIGSWNQFTAASEFQNYSDRVGLLWMKEQSFVTNRHYIDCSGQVILEPYAAVGGIKSIIQTHELDIAENVTTVGRVVFGEKAVSSTACVMLKDSYLPKRSMLAAGAVLVKAKPGGNLPESGLYAGAPARFVKEIKDFVWWTRDSYYTPVTGVDDEKFGPADNQPDAVMRPLSGPRDAQT